MNFWNRLLDRDTSPLPHIPWAVSLVYRNAPLESVALVTTGLIRRLGPPAALLVLQRVIDAVAAGGGVQSFTRPLGYLAAVLILTELANSLINMADGRTFEKLEVAVQQMTLERTTRLTMDQFDEPAIHDLIERATKNTTMRVARLFWLVMEIATTTAGALSALLLVAAASPLVALVAILVGLPVSWVGVRQGARLHELTQRQSPGRRFTQYLGGLLSSREAATELRAYQLVPYFLARWRQSFAQRRADHLDVRWAGTKEGWLASLAAGALYAVALGAITMLANRGQVGAGQIVVLIGAVRILQGAMSQVATRVGFLWEHGLPTAEFRQFMALSKVEPPTDQGRPFPEPLRTGICFENVSFRYPGGKAPVLDGVTLTIHPGEKVALVGENGAGKSTLIKLLLGLYQPTGGRITVDGIDLNAVAPAALRRNLSCVFQDFVRYDMPLYDNVAAGRLGADLPDVEAACQAGGLQEAVSRLPDGYQTMLGKTFTGGVDLSGGQWQRVALARAFIRGAQVIVLDEPTAALDPRAELEVFGKFVDLVRGKTAVLISHRLGSARLADRVIVLGEGRVLETGSHDELMATGGHYAELFRMQAQWYVDDVAPAAGEEAI
jgi:ATP-binding cassette, subfamily B, bacterial